MALAAMLIVSSAASKSLQALPPTVTALSLPACSSGARMRSLMPPAGAATENVSGSDTLAWTEYADARSEALRKVRMAVGRARNALVAAAFGAFALFLQDVLAKKAKARADADRMLLRIMNREVWLGFRCFDQVWQAANREAELSLTCSSSR